jgi:spore germination cell wall hydrolase CwlJ-like protein
MNKRLKAECIFVVSVIAIGLTLTFLQQTGSQNKPEMQEEIKVESVSCVTPNVSRSNLETDLKEKHEAEANKKVNKKEPVEESKKEETQIKEQVQKPAKSYTDEDLYVLSHVIMGEASGQSWEHKEAVGSVVLNRVKDSRFPNTIKGVVFQKGQYACTWDGNYNKTPDEETINVARYLLENGSQLPEYVIFGAQFKQANRVYKKIDNTYFCYYAKDAK